MKKVFKAQNVILGVNVMMIVAIFILNYFYQKGGFDFTLKCICITGFALVGLINLVYTLGTKQSNLKFHISMLLGLILAMLGDVLIGYNFIVGVGAFSLGHVCFIFAYCFLKKLGVLDFAISMVLFVGAGAFLQFCPLLNFNVPIFKVVCIVYALIISLMLGKALGNFIRQRNTVNGTIAIASALFFFSDLMLVFDWFIGLWDWTDHACMGTYYPAPCFLALSMIVKMLSDSKKSGGK